MSYLAPCLCQRRFDRGNPAGEVGTRRVLVLTLITMVVEIIAGQLFNSMSLLADGWHMSSHAVAMGMALLAYWAARRYAGDLRFAYGTWKIEILGSFASALLLLMVALGMVIESVGRMFNPLPIAFDQAAEVAVLGLAVNLFSAWLLMRGDGHGHHGHEHGHGHAHDHPHDHEHLHQDLNLRSAYLHVLADAATSVAAIVALLAGKYAGAVWLDPVIGIAGSVLVARWAISLLSVSGRVLLDAEMDAGVVAEVRDAVAAATDGAGRLLDLHVWRVGRAQYACVLTVAGAVDAGLIHTHLAEHAELVHVTVEVRAAA